MQITNRRLSELTPYAANAKKHDKRQINNVADGDKSEICQMTFTLHEQQKELIEYAMTCVEDEITETFGNANKNGNALYEVIRQWAAQKT